MNPDENHSQISKIALRGQWAGQSKIGEAPQRRFNEPNHFLLIQYFQDILTSQAFLCQKTNNIFKNVLTRLTILKNLQYNHKYFIQANHYLSKNLHKF